MPITAEEWNNGSLSTEQPNPEPVPVASTEEVTDEVRSFLEANADTAFSRAEIVRGVNASTQLEPAQLGEVLAELPNQLADLSADFTAGGIDVDSYSAAVDQLREAGKIACGKIRRADGEPIIYYRYAGETSTAGESVACRRD